MKEDFSAHPITSNTDVSSQAHLGSFDSLTGAERFIGTANPPGRQVLHDLGFYEAQRGHKSWHGYFSDDMYHRNPKYIDQIYSTSEMGALITTQAAVLKNSRGQPLANSFENFDLCSTGAPLLPEQTNGYLIAIGRTRANGIVVLATNENRSAIEDIHTLATQCFLDAISKSDRMGTAKTIERAQELATKLGIPNRKF